MRGHYGFLVVLWAIGLFSANGAHALTNRIETSAGNLKVDGKELPYLFGAETQYFRARGGPERNVDRNEVIALWSRLLDRVQEARMNLVSLYIPWDFHEPKEGVFDFTGTLDQDGDKRPDYPSRDLKTYLRMIEARGIKYVMLRPGPYINAEWGPTGFGAIPLWYLNQYPNTLMKSQTKDKPRTVSFFQPVYRDHVRKWFRVLYEQVLKDFVGPNRMGVFVQLDNETNYFWDSAYERDYSDDSIARYREWLAAKYVTVAELNKVYGSAVKKIAEVVPPRSASDVTYAASAWHYDWFKFHDLEIRDYYRFLRQAWRDAGLPESQVLFTRCDSYNTTTPTNLLPRLDFGQRDQLALTTLNVYPKTDPVPGDPTLDTPMKGAHDAGLLASSHQSYWGDLGHWLMATETIGGWFPPVKVTLETRQHTYGSLLGSDVKAMTIYYFHEGWNWSGLEGKDTPLNFDAPLDRDMNARESFKLIADLGKTLESGLGDRAIKSANLNAPILIAHDSHAQYPVPGGPDTERASSNDSAGIFGAFREAGTLADVAFIDAIDADQLSKKYKLIVFAGTGYFTAPTKAKLSTYLARGGYLAVFGGPNPADLGLTANRIKYFPTNILAKWNMSDYVKDPAHGDSLVQVNQLLAAAGITPQVTVTAADKDSYVHVWLRPATDGGNSLLFVENFLPVNRDVKIQFDPKINALPAKFKLVRRWSNLKKSGIAPEPMSNADTATGSIADGVTLATTADGVDIWETSAAK